MALNSGRQETLNLSVEIHAGSGEGFIVSNDLASGRAETFTLVKEIGSGAAETFSLLNGALFDAYNGHTTAGQEWIPHVAPNCMFNLFLKNSNVTENLSPFISRLEIKKTLDGKQTVSFSLKEYGTTFSDYENDIGASAFTDMLVKLQPTSINPFYNDFGNTTGRLYKHNFTTRTTLAVRIDYGYDQTGYSSWDSPTFLPEEPSFDGETLRWSGGDLIGLLEKENQTMSDANADADPPLVKTAHGMIREMTSFYGIPNVVINFPDFIVRLMRRSKGRPLDWVDSLLEIYQAKRYFNGNTLYLQPATPPHLGEAKWTFVESLHIIEGSLEVEQDLSNYKNRFTVSRQSPKGGVIGEAECVGPQCVGRTVNITLDQEVNSLNVMAQAASGVIEEYVYFDANNNPVLPDSVYALGPSGPTYIGGVPVKRIEATYNATIGVGGTPLYNYNTGPVNTIQLPYVPRYTITVFGRKASALSLDDTYNFTAQDTDGINIFGLHAEYDNIENELIPTSSVGAAHAQALLRESTRKVWHCRFRTKFVNPKLEPGDIIKIQDYPTHQTDVKWLVEEVTITHENGDQEMMVYCTRGRL